MCHSLSDAFEESVLLHRCRMKSTPKEILQATKDAFVQKWDHIWL